MISRMTLITSDDIKEYKRNSCCSSMTGKQIKKYKDEKKKESKENITKVISTSNIRNDEFYNYFEHHAYPWQRFNTSDVLDAFLNGTQAFAQRFGFGFVRQETEEEQMKKTKLNLEHQHFCKKCSKEISYFHAFEMGFSIKKKELKLIPYSNKTEYEKMHQKLYKQFQEKFDNWWTNNTIQFLCCDCYDLAIGLEQDRKEQLDKFKQTINDLKKYGFETVDLEFFLNDFRNQLESNSLPNFFELPDLKSEILYTRGWRSTSIIYDDVPQETYGGIPLNMSIGFSKGGIVSKETLQLITEHGHDTIVPLEVSPSIGFAIDKGNAKKNNNNEEHKNFVRYRYV